MRSPVPRALAAAALLLLAGALAGCSGKGGKDGGEPTDYSKLGLKPPTSTTGLIRGVVVDDAIRPVAGATVTLRSKPPATAQSQADGAFGFDGLPPGTYFLSVHKAGYADVQQGAEVVAGVAEPPSVKVQLLRDAAFVAPFAESFTFDGFLECSAGVVADAGDYGVENACAEEVPMVGKPFSNDASQATHTPAGRPDWVQSEMVWTSTQAASHSMTLSFAVPSDDTVSHPDHWDDLSVYGASPLVDTMDRATAEHYLGNGTLTLRVFPWADQAPGVVLAVEQRFTIYTTVFYGYVPPAGWLFASDGAVPPPPQ